MIDRFAKPYTRLANIAIVTSVRSFTQACTARCVELFSGTTIMGDGRVATILDLAGTVRTSEGNTAALHSTRTFS